MDNLFLMNDKTFFRVSNTDDVDLMKELADANNMKMVKLEYSDKVHKEYDHRMEDSRYRKVFDLIEKIINDNDYNDKMFNKDIIIGSMIDSYYNFYKKLHGITDRILKGIEDSEIILSRGNTDNELTIDIDLFLEFIHDRESERFFNFN